MKTIQYAALCPQPCAAVPQAAIVHEQGVGRLMFIGCVFGCCVFGASMAVEESLLFGMDGFGSSPEGSVHVPRASCPGLGMRMGMGWCRWDDQQLR